MKGDKMMAKTVTKLRLRGFLSDRFSSQLEQSYLDDDHVLVLKDVDCEMQFDSVRGFFRYETEQHNYLPVFHLLGSVREIVGDFPYGVNRIYFGESDKAYLSKDISYYPSPRELAYIVSKCGFFTKDFKIPNILVTNSYSFPVKVDLIVVPPDNGEDIGADRMSVPIFYVTLKGTGVSRKTDKLLDYYGINVDPSYPSYALTAESSGYTDPDKRLLEYIEEVKPVQVTAERLSRDQYLQPEEEAELLRFHENQAERVVRDTQTVFDVPEPTKEDVMLAVKSRQIGDRVAHARQLALESKGKAVPASEPEPTHEGVEPPAVDGLFDMSNILEKPVQSDTHTMSDVFSSDIFVDNKDTGAGEALFAPLKEPVDSAANFDGLEVVSKDKAAEDIVESSAEDIVEDVARDDVFEQRDKNAADVADVDEQTKLEEERVTKNAQATAVEIQQEETRTEEYFPKLSFFDITSDDQHGQDDDSLEPC